MHKSTPLFHIVKRKALPWYHAWGIRGAAIVLALIVCGIVTAMATGLNPLAVYGTMIDGAFGTTRRVWILLQNLAILLCISLAVTPAFRMRFWNIGAEGQVLIGGLATAACMILLGGKLPNGLLIVIMILAAVAAGAIWAMIPAIFKAKWNTNETLLQPAGRLLCHRLGVPEGLRQDRHHQPEHGGGLAAPDRRAEVSSEYHHRRGADGRHVCLSELYQARL